MRPMPNARTGLAALYAALFLTACSSSGPKQPTLPGPTTERLIEVEKQRLVAVDRALTEVPPLRPAPAPEVPAGPGCSRRLGCYSGRQLEGMLTEALEWGRQMADKLRAIERLGDEAERSEGERP